ncbi:MAG: hypothetical protein NT027_04335, partial [Proteobacteria bacterium]|nr:hypothetical protein [Pseudomonadota bacterium]
RNELEQKKIILVTIADNNDPILESIPELATNASLNNKFKINPLKIGQSLGIHEKSLNRNVNVTLQSEIYFNRNSDLQK